MTDAFRILNPVTYILKLILSKNNCFNSIDINPPTTYK